MRHRCRLHSLDSSFFRKIKSLAPLPLLEAKIGFIVQFGHDNIVHILSDETLTPQDSRATATWAKSKSFVC